MTKSTRNKNFKWQSSHFILTILTIQFLVIFLILIYSYFFFSLWGKMLLYNRYRYMCAHTHRKVTFYVSFTINASFYCLFYQENCNMLRRNTFEEKYNVSTYTFFGPRTLRSTLNLNILFTCATKNKAEGSESNFVSRSQ